MDDFKKCTKCDTIKPASEFHREATRVGGLSFYCKECNKAKSRLRRMNDPRSVKSAGLKHKFNITMERYDKMLDAQGGVCAICGKADVSGRALSVDHDHSCCPGKKSCGECVRSLLCGNCNMGLGKFQDDPELLRAAIDYLKR